MKDVVVWLIVDKKGRPVRDLYSGIPEMHPSLRQAKSDLFAWDCDDPAFAPHSVIKAKISAVDET